MKKFLKRILYKDLRITEYESITIRDTISEKVFLKTNDFIIDVSQDHWALCLQPIVFGIWLNKQTAFSLLPNNNYQLFFEETAPQKKLAEIQLSFFDTVEDQDGTLLLVKADKCKLFHVSFIETFFLYASYYRKPGFSFQKFSSYVSAFSYPRKVRIVSFQKEDYYNIFPMDFVGKIGETNRYLFGLRHTNQTLSEIIRAKKLVVSEVSFAYKKDIYKLGRFHSFSPPSLKQLPFKTLPSRNFGFPVPVWAESYNEINITQTANLGSHMLLWGESQHEEIRNNGPGNLYHIHFLLSLFQKRKGADYIHV